MQITNKYTLFAGRDDGLDFRQSDQSSQAKTLQGLL
jgi:hypothetical protein